MELAEAGKGVGQFAYMEKNHEKTAESACNNGRQPFCNKKYDTKKQDKKTYNTAGHFCTPFRRIAP